jgi:Protein of unknown function (DUF3667)
MSTVSPTSDDPSEPKAPEVTEAVMREPKKTPYSLASLLDLDEADLAEPLSRAAPPEHRWEQMSIGMAPETGEATSTPMRRGVATQPPDAGTELIPGSDVPGAVQVPVYLAGRALHDLMQGSAIDDGDLLALSESHAVLPSAEPAADGWTMPPSMEAAASTTTPLSTGAITTPVRGPAIAQKVTGRARKKQDAPAALFTKTEHGPLVWPSRRPSKTPRVTREECPRCQSLYVGPTCTACGFEAALPVRIRKSGMWHELGNSFLESDSRIIRTIGALAFVPGELTDAFLAGQRKRYLGPILLTAIALLIFGVASAFGSLRPRPDRALSIGAEHTALQAPGLSNPAAVNLQVDAQPDLISDMATTMDYIPVLWFALMLTCVCGTMSAMRSFQLKDDYAEWAFGAHFSAWFVVMWAVVVPIVLLAVKFGFELSAGWEGVTRIRYTESGDIEGLSRRWNTFRAITVSPYFHSALLATGLLPWAIVAYRRVFDSSWGVAVVVGVVITAIPILLLQPFN